MFKGLMEALFSQGYGVYVFAFLVVLVGMTTFLFLWRFPYFYKKYSFPKELEFMVSAHKWILKRSDESGLLKSRSLDDFQFKFDLVINGTILQKIGDGFSDIYEPPALQMMNCRVNSIFPTLKFLAEIERKSCSSQLVCIEGGAGFGKTNFLKYVGYLTLRGETVFDDAIYISARTVESFHERRHGELDTLEEFLFCTGDTLAALLLYSWKNKIPGLKAVDVLVFSKKKSLVLVDGMDEIRNVANGEAIAEILRRIKGELTAVEVLLAGRPGYLPKYGSDESHDWHFRLLSMNQDRIFSLIEKSFNKIYGREKSLKEIEEFTLRIVSNAALFDLARVPLLLTLIIALRLESKVVPEHRDALVDEFVMTSIKRRLAVTNSLAIDFIRKVLARLSYQYSRRDEGEVSISEVVESELSKWGRVEPFDDANKTISFINSTGLVVHGVEFEFVHRFIFEHLCAVYLTSYLKTRLAEDQRGVEYLSNCSSDAAFFVCCLLEDATSVFEKLIECGRFDVCVELVIWKEMGSNIRICSKIMDRFWAALRAGVEGYEFAEVQLYLLLTRLKCGLLISDRPVAASEYKYLVGSLDDGHVIDGYVVGLSSNEVDRFFRKLNARFPEGRGQYGAVSLHYAYPSKSIGSGIKDDFVVRGVSGYSVRAAENGYFSQAKGLIFAEALSVFNKSASSLHRRFSLFDCQTFIAEISRDVEAEIHPNLFLNRFQFSESMSDVYARFVSLLFGDSGYRKYQFSRGGIDLHQLIVGSETLDREKSVYDSFSAGLVDYFKQDVLTLEMAQRGALYRLFISLFMDGCSREFAVAKAIFARSLMFLLISQKKIQPWGRLFVQFNVDHKAARI